MLHCEIAKDTCPEGGNYCCVSCAMRENCNAVCFNDPEKCKLSKEVEVSE